MQIRWHLARWRRLIRQRPRNPVRLWTPEFIRICTSNSFMSIVLQMLISAFPLYLAAQGISSKQVGMVISGYTACTLIMRFLSGSLVDRYGRFIVVFICSLMFLIPLSGFLLWPVLPVIVLCRVFQGLGASGLSTGYGAMVADVLPRERFAEGIGYFGLFSAIITAIGPALAVRLCEDGQYTFLFILCVVLFLIGIVLLFTVRYERHGGRGAARQQADQPQQAAEPAPKNPLWRFLDKPAIPIACVCFLSHICVAAALNYAAPFAVSLGLSGSGLFFTFQAFSMLFTRVFSGRFSVRFGNFRVLFVGMILMFTSIVLIGFVNSLGLLLVAGLIYGAGCGLAWPMFNVLCLINSPASHRGRALSTYYISYDGGVGLGALLWGFVIDAVGYRWVFWSSAVIAVISLILAVVLRRRAPWVYGETPRQSG